MGRDPTSTEIAEQLQMEVAKVEEIMLLVKEPMSLDTPVGDDTDSTFASFIEDESLLLQKRYWTTRRFVSKFQLHWQNSLLVKKRFFACDTESVSRLNTRWKKLVLGSS